MSETVEAPQLALAPDVQKAITEAFGELIEKAWSNESKLAKASPVEEPKSWFADPFSMLDSMGMGYRTAPSTLTYETRGRVAERNDIVASVHFTRANQVAAFARPQPNKYSVGFVVRPRFGNKHKRLTDSERERVDEITYFLLHTGRDYNIGRDDMETFLRKFVRDSLTHDQGNFETVMTQNRRPHTFHAVDASTIRIANPKITKGTPPNIAQMKRDIRYVQLINAQITAEFTAEELAFCVRNPRTDIKSFNYGLPEIDVLMTTITSHLWAEEWNRRLFSQGSTTKGVLNIKGNLPQAQFEAFKRMWYAQVSGVSNAWKTPLLNGEDVQFIPLQMNNTEMGYQMWMEYLIKIVTAIYQIDPAEINFDLRGGAGQQPVFMSSNEAQQKASKDRGLQPLLRFIETQINRFIVWRIDPRFEFAFVGLDAKTEEQAMQLRMQQVTNIYTLNEVRAMEDLPPVKEGDIVLNPTYTGYLLQKANAAMQQQMMQQQPQMGAPGGQPGGAQGQQQPQLPPGPTPEQPYADQFKGRPPGKEEHQAAEQVRQMQQPQGGGLEHADDESTDDGDGAGIKRYLPTLEREDWSSTVHAAIPEEDLRKSEDLYELIDLD